VGRVDSVARLSFFGGGFIIGFDLRFCGVAAQQGCNRCLDAVPLLLRFFAAWTKGPFSVSIQVQKKNATTPWMDKFESRRQFD